MKVSIQEAYAEACQALGEQIVERRLIDRVDTQTDTQAEEDAKAPDGEKVNE